jgi:ketosteroid isomerase-like protein
VEEIGTSWYRAYLDAWDRCDVEGVLSFVTDDVDFADVGAGHAFRGKEKMARFVRKSFELVPDVTFDLVEGAEFGDSYWYEWIMRPMGVRGASVGRTREGKMAYNRDYWNAATFSIPGAEA